MLHNHLTSHHVAAAAKRSGDEDDFADMALDAELPGDDATAEAAPSLKQPTATAKAKKARKKKVRRLRIVMLCVTSRQRLQL